MDHSESPESVTGRAKGHRKREKKSHRERDDRKERKSGKKARKRERKDAKKARKRERKREGKDHRKRARDHRGASPERSSSHKAKRSRRERRSSSSGSGSESGSGESSSSDEDDDDDDDDHDDDDELSSDDAGPALPTRPLDASALEQASGALRALVAAFPAPEFGAELRGLLERYADEEDGHRAEALRHGAEATPGYRPLSRAIRLGTRLAIRLSERI